MQYRLRTLMILMAVLPPLIGFWPSIKRRVVERATQTTASDVAVLASASSLIAIRVRLYLSNNVQAPQEDENPPAAS